MKNAIPFLDLSHQNLPLKSEFIKELSEIIDKSWYILGDSVQEFELNYAKFNEVSYAVGVSNGLDALHLSLKALEIKPNDEVIVPANTYIASVLAITNVGAKPIFVEPKLSTYNINPELINEKITEKTKVIMPVHLYGQACEMDKITDIAKCYELKIVEDNAQAHGALYLNKLTGSWGDINATSFYPGKNLGALGDAGAITTNNIKLAESVKLLRNYGSKIKYQNEIPGYNMRLDELQAAFLSIKLKHLNKWNLERNKIASYYTKELKNISEINVPVVHKNANHTYHLYVIKAKKRDQLQAYLNKKGIGTLIHYPIPPYLQKAYSTLIINPELYPISQNLADSVLSLPIWPGLRKSQQQYIIDQIKNFYTGK